MVTPGAYASHPQNPTPQRNDPIISEAIFGFDGALTPINPKQDFSTNFSQLPPIAEEMYQGYVTDVKQLDRELQKEELTYYSTALLWLRLLLSLNIRT